VFCTFRNVEKTEMSKLMDERLKLVNNYETVYI
jgi:hypothetical protein